MLVDIQGIGCRRVELHQLVRYRVYLTLDFVDVTCNVYSLAEGVQRCPQDDLRLKPMTRELPIILRGLALDGRDRCLVLLGK